MQTVKLKEVGRKEGPNEEKESYIHREIYIDTWQSQEEREEERKDRHYEKKE